MTWRAFVEKLRPDIYDPPVASTIRSQSHMDTHIPPPPSSSPSSSTARDKTPTQADEAYLADLESAFDLLEQLLNPDCTRRITPEKALYHAFLAPPSPEEQDNEFFPHPFGKGVCSEDHYLDDVTNYPWVRYKVRLENGEWKWERRCLLAGEGIAIGKQPCEFHREEFLV